MTTPDNPDIVKWYWECQLGHPNTVQGPLELYQIVSWDHAMLDIDLYATIPEL